MRGSAGISGWYAGVARCRSVSAWIALIIIAVLGTTIIGERRIKVISPHCDRCGNLLNEPGGLVFSPPLDTDRKLVAKYHVCHDCWMPLLKWMSHPPVRVMHGRPSLPTTARALSDKEMEDAISESCQYSLDLTRKIALAHEQAGHGDLTFK